MVGRDSWAASAGSSLLRSREAGHCLRRSSCCMRGDRGCRRGGSDVLGVTDVVFVVMARL